MSSIATPSKEEPLPRQARMTSDDLSGALSPLFGPHKFCLVLHNVFSPEECAALIERSESVGYEPAPFNVGGGRQRMMTDVRNNDRCIIDDPDLAEELWRRVRSGARLAGKEEELLRVPWVSPFGSGPKHRAVGCNERLRFLRYDPGTFFAPHGDGSYRRGPEAGPREGEASHVTAQLYLNEGFEGGATRFLGWNDSASFSVSVRPRTGSVLLFEHNLCHEGSVLTKGRKYAIRTDVMYTEKGPGWEYSLKVPGRDKAKHPYKTP